MTGASAAPACSGPAPRPSWRELATATAEAGTAFTVHSFKAGEWLLWSKADSTWAWTLGPLASGSTRLVTRVRARYDWNRPLYGLTAMILMELGDFAMLRRMLRGIKARAESTVPSTRPFRR